VRSRKDKGAQMARRNPYGYIIAGRTRPHAYSATRDFPYEDRVEAKRVIGERVRGMGRRGDDVSFDAYLTEPRGRKIRKTRIRVPGFTASRGLSRNPDVRLHWTSGDYRGRPPLKSSKAWWRVGLKKPKEVKRAVRAAHKYARKQKDWLSHRVTVENPRKSVKRKLASRWAKRRPRNAKGRFVKIKKRGSRRR
jgi:hypothetical protein